MVVLTGRWSNEAPPHERVEGVEVRRLSTLRWLFRFPGTRRFSQDRYASSLAGWLRPRLGQFDLIHVHSMRRGAAVVLPLAAEAGVPVLVKEPNSGLQNTFRTLGRDPGEDRMRKLFLERLRHVVVLNDEAEAEYGQFGFRALRIHRAFNGDRAAGRSLVVSEHAPDARGPLSAASGEGARRLAARVRLARRSIPRMDAAHLRRRADGAVAPRPRA